MTRKNKKIVLLVLVGLALLSLIFLNRPKLPQGLEQSSNIREIKTRLKMQDNLENNYNNYFKQNTFSNPKIIKNPYEFNANTIQLVFSTPEETAINISVETEDKEVVNLNYPKAKEHIINVIGLVATEKNKIKMTDDSGNKKEIEIEVQGLPKDAPKLFVENRIIAEDEIYFYTPLGKDYIVGIDKYNRVRTMLYGYTSDDITVTDKGNFLSGSNQKINNFLSTAIVETNVLGKIVKNFEIDGGIYPTVAEFTNDFVTVQPGENDSTVSLLKVDKNNGEIKDKLSLKKGNGESANYINYKVLNYKNNILFINYITKQLVLVDYNTMKVLRTINLNTVSDDISYNNLNNNTLTLISRNVEQDNYNNYNEVREQKSAYMINLLTGSVAKTTVTEDALTTDINNKFIKLKLSDLNTEDEKTISIKNNNSSSFETIKLTDVINPVTKYKTTGERKDSIKDKYKDITDNFWYPKVSMYVDSFDFNSVVYFGDQFDEKLITYYKQDNKIFVTGIFNKDDELSLIVGNNEEAQEYKFDIKQSFDNMNEKTMIYVDKDISYVNFRGMKTVNTDTDKNVYLKLNGKIYNLSIFITKEDK